MTLITFEDGKPLMKEDGKIGTEQACCCKECSGPCEYSEDCAPGCACVDGECEEQECSGISAGNGWYTDSEKQDLMNFLATAGYSNPTFTPAQPFNDPVPLPYSSPCDQVYYNVTYECCGVSGADNPCDPSFFITNILTVFPGNKSPPCNPQSVENFLWACCEEEPPP